MILFLGSAIFVNKDRYVLQWRRMRQTSGGVMYTVVHLGKNKTTISSYNSLYIVEIAFTNN